MAGPLFPIQNFVAVPYVGFLQGTVVSLLTKGGVRTNDGQVISAGQQSKVVNTTFDFLSTQYQGQAVSINLQSTNNTPPLDAIEMIFVDNELNSQDVTVAFPDTQQYIGVPAFTTGYYPVLTGQRQAVIYNGTSGKPPVTAQSQVSVIFCNFAMPGFLSQETLSVTFNSSTGPVVPVIGDLVSTIVQQTADGSIQTILPEVAPPQRYVITGMEVNATNLFVDLTSYILSILLEAIVGGVAVDVVRLFNIAIRSDFSNTRFSNICDETGLNIPVQGLVVSFANLNTLTSVVLPPWTAVTVSITYALVTL